MNKVKIIDTFYRQNFYNRYQE